MLGFNYEPWIVFSITAYFNNELTCLLNVGLVRTQDKYIGMQDTNKCLARSL